MNHTRTITHPDGRREIIRVFDTQALQSWSADDPHAYEHSIIWLRDVSALDYVRVATIKTARSRQGRLRAGEGQITIVGYSRLTDDAPPDSVTKAYVRRIFFLSDQDARANMNSFPADAVDPNSLAPGVEGQPPRPVKSELGYPYYLRHA